jgi:hypothetical protein
LTCCFLIAGCGPDRQLTPLRPDISHPERFECDAVSPGDRPAIDPEHVIDWAKVQTVEQAKAEHLAYVKSIRSREGVITGYIVRLEGQLFTCANNMTWQREYYANLPGGR